jgi:8-oxo-dGTP pyrophosphatase MutT (NUDIX family)
MDNIYTRVVKAHPFNDDTNDKVGVIIKNFDHALLVVKGISGKYSFPKGSRKVGETDWESAAREAWEEAGIDISDMIHVGESNLKYGKYFILRLKTRYLNCKPNEENTLSTCWMFKNELREQYYLLNADLKAFCDIKP